VGKTFGKKLYPKENQEELLKLKERIMRKTPRLLPLQLQEFLNLQTSKCPVCPEFCSKSHLEGHGLKVPSYKEVMREIDNKTLEAKKSKLPRNKSLEELGKFVDIYSNRIKDHLNQKQDPQPPG